jgi:hypothetical protein
MKAHKPQAATQKLQAPSLKVELLGAHLAELLWAHPTEILQAHPTELLRVL